MNKPWLLTATAVLGVLMLVGAGCDMSSSDDEVAESDDVSVESSSTTESAGTSSAVASTTDVTIQNFAFGPSDITVQVGDTVTWTNADLVGHTVTSDGTDTTLDSPLLSQGKSFSFTFDEVGEFAYHCTPHPNMTGTVTVTE